MDRLAQWGSRLGWWVFFGTMSVGAWLMLSASASYVELGDAHPFVLEKLPLNHPGWWRAALYVHVPSALFALPACLVLLAHPLHRRFPRVHRWLGRAVCALVLLAVVPSGMYLALYAQGGVLSTLGFWLTGAITFVSMLKSIQSARRRDMRAHRRFSAHVAAQLSVAVISRFALLGAETLGLYDDATYVLALWIPVLASALVAELATRSQPSPSLKGARHEKIVAIARVDPVR
jgi:uncharacterized membrane protein